LAAGLSLSSLTACAIIFVTVEHKQTKTGPLTWYGVRCIFKGHDDSAYEERVTLWRAESFEHAIERAEAEAVAYAANVDFEYLGLAQAFDTKAVRITNGAEVFSLIRNSSLQPRDYLDRFFDTGTERQGTSVGRRQT
jgi:hypothetical protein